MDVVTAPWLLARAFSLARVLNLIHTRVIKTLVIQLQVGDAERVRVCAACVCAYVCVAAGQKNNKRELSVSPARLAACVRIPRIPRLKCRIFFEGSAAVNWMRF